MVQLLLTKWVPRYTLEAHGITITYEVGAPIHLSSPWYNYYLLVALHTGW